MVSPRWILAPLLPLALCLSASAHACGLEPTFEKGLAISYPGALEVAVAVAEARRLGLLPQASRTVSSNEARLHQMLADLRRLQSRLESDGAGVAGDVSASFSIVLVGPGLWSRYYLTSNGAIAQYHTPGPRAGEVVVMMHHSVLEALLEGSLTTGVAAERGLIAFAGDHPAPIRQVFETSFPGRAHASWRDERPRKEA